MNINNIFTNPKDIKYNIKEIEYSRGNFASQISNNEQYLAYGGEQEVLNIYDIKLDKIIKKIWVNYQILVCQFTFDSSRLYVGCQFGYVYGYETQTFTKILKQKFKDHIYYIVTIKNQYLITICRNKTITKTDMKRNKRIFKSNGDTFNSYRERREDYIDAMDYNQSDDIIVIGYLESIQLWDCKNRRNFIENIKSQNSSLDVSSNLYKWKIDYVKKDLIKIQEFRVPCQILSFYSVNQDQNLLMICEGYLKVINNQGETIYTLYHQSKKFDIFFDSRQLDNLRYINIRDRRFIYLAIQEN